MTAALFSVMAIFSVAALAEGGDDGYKLGVGDKIGISVLNEPDLSLEVTVNDQGRITYPFLGELRVSGVTVQGLREAIANGLKPDYLLDPRVTVHVVAYRNFYINGEVEKPGGFPWEPGMTVRKAAAMAGGFTDRASRSRIFVIRENDLARIPVQISADTPVQPGDIITIEQSFF